MNIELVLLVVEHDDYCSTKVKVEDAQDFDDCDM